ncbi:MAG: hypothetical protein LBF84_00100 [Holosporales bacterium]|nr:hypothetical protein [Holosporales bacterium]
MFDLGQFFGVNLWSPEYADLPVIRRKIPQGKVDLGIANESMRTLLALPPRMTALTDRLFSDKYLMTPTVSSVSNGLKHAQTILDNVSQDTPPEQRDSAKWQDLLAARWRAIRVRLAAIDDQVD